MSSSAEDTLSDVSSYSQSPPMRVNIQKALKKPVVGLSLLHKGSVDLINKSTNRSSNLVGIPYKATEPKIISHVQKVPKPNNRVTNALQMLNKLDKRYSKPIVKQSKNLAKDTDSISLSSNNSSIGDEVKDNPPNKIKQINDSTVSKKVNSLDIKKSTNTPVKSKPERSKPETTSVIKSTSEQDLELNLIKFDKSNSLDNDDLQYVDVPVLEEIDYESDFESSDSDGSEIQVQELHNAREKMMSSSLSSIHTEIDNISQISNGSLNQQNLELVIPYKNNYHSDNESTNSFEHADRDGKRIKKSSETERSSMPDTEKAESVSSNYESDDSQPFHLNILTFEEFQNNQVNKRATVSPQQNISPNLKNIHETDSVQNIDSNLPQRITTPDHSRSEEEVEELLDGTDSSEELLRSLSERTELKHDANFGSIAHDLRDDVHSGSLSKENKIAKADLATRDCVIEEQHNSSKEIIVEKEMEQETNSTSTKSESSNTRKRRKKLTKHKHKNVHTIGVQTDANNLPRERRFNPEFESRNKSKRIPQPRLEHLKLSWDLDSSPRWDRLTDPNDIFLDLPPEVIEAFAIQKPSADSMNSIMKQHIRLTRKFMAAQYQMYVNYSNTVKSMCETYEPVTLEETKKFIAAHRESRTKT